MKKEYFMGIDVGSVSVKIALLSKEGKVVMTLYERSNGKPLERLKGLFKKIPSSYNVLGVGITGSARLFIGKIIGADIIKNEITAHSAALSKFYPKARTVIEIGGQDSKIIIFKNRVPVDFAMNSVCAAGTGSFLDQQASRLRLPIEDFGIMALKSKKELNVGGRCTVFAESDMIQKQQAGHDIRDIVNGLCNNLVKNYLNNVAKGKDMEKPFILLGGVAANKGIVRAFERELRSKMIIPEHYNVMGAIGMAILAMKDAKNSKKETRFRGLRYNFERLKKETFQCRDCANFCDVMKVDVNGDVSHIGSKCEKYK